MKDPSRHSFFESTAIDESRRIEPRYVVLTRQRVPKRPTYFEAPTICFPVLSFCVTYRV
jgi:hypothetical protein